MVAAITFDGEGNAVFRNRFVRTKGFVEELSADRMLYKGQFSLRPGGWMANAFDMRPKNVANTNVLHWKGCLFALWEGGKPVRVDPRSLATLGESNLAGALSKQDTFSAHPSFDSHTGRLVGFTYNPEPMAGKTVLSVWEFAANGFDLHSRRDIEIPGFAFLHDVVVTEHYYVWSLAPTELANAQVLQAFAGLEAIGDTITFNKDKPAKLVLVPRDGSEVQWVDVDTHCCFHFSNGFEDEDGQVVIDMFRVEEFLLQQTLKKAEDLDTFPKPELWRYKVDPASHRWTARKLCSRFLEFPSVDKRVCGKRYKYLYCGTTATGKAGPFQGVAKIDIEAEDPDNNADVWVPEPYEFSGEPLFCPREGASDEEDDGYILCYLLNGETHASEIVVLDAQKVSEGPIARVKLHTYLPHGLHGAWAPGFVPSREDIEKAWDAVPISL